MVCALKHEMLKLILFSLISVSFISISAHASRNLCSAILNASTANEVLAPESSAEKFGYDDKHAWGPQIYFHEFTKLQKNFTDLQHLPWPELQAQLSAMDMRKIFFHIRVLSETYRGLDPKFFKKQIPVFKNIEYLLGRVDLYKSIQELLVPFNEPQLEAYFIKLGEDSSRDLQQGLKDFGALKNPGEGLAQLEKKFRSYDNWLSQKKDRKYLLNEMIDFAKSLNKEVNKNAFDSDQLEQGLHKMRRSLRELLFRMVNLQHLSQVVDEGQLPMKLNDWYVELEKNNPNILKSPYMPESIPEVEDAIILPKKIAAILTEIVTLIGVQKDQDEPLMYLEQAAKEIPDLDQQSRLRILDKIANMSVGIENQRQVVDSFQERIRKSQVLEYFIQFLENKNKK